MKPINKLLKRSTCLWFNVMSNLKKITKIPTPFSFNTFGTTSSSVDVLHEGHFNNLSPKTFIGPDVAA